jgi:DNA-binding beta-propeller fold protein YncE
VPALEGAESVAVSRDGKNVYVASYKANALVVLERAQGGGLLRTLAGTGSCVSYGGAHGCAAGTALKGANSVAISRNGRSVYVASYRSDAVAIFDRNAGSGALTQKAGRSGCVSEEGTGGACTRAKALDAPESIIVSPDGRNVYVLSDKSNAVTVFDRRADGGLELKHGLRGCISEDGTHDGDGTARCADGAGLNIRDGANAIALSPDGTNVYVAANDSGAVAILDRDATGALSQDRVSGCWSDKRRDRCRVSSSLAGAATVSVSPDGRHVYVGSFEADAIVIFERDAHSGALTRKPGRAGCWAMGPGREGCAMAKALNGVYSVTVSPDGKNLYVAAYMADALSIFDRR